MCTVINRNIVRDTTVSTAAGIAVPVRRNTWIDTQSLQSRLDTENVLADTGKCPGGCSSNQPQRIIVEPTSDIHVTSLGERLILVVSASVRKLRKLAFLFILLILVMPTQVSALGFVNLITKMDLMDSLVPLFLPSIAAPAVFYFMYSYMQSPLPLELILSSNEKKNILLSKYIVAGVTLGGVKE